jgi:lipopolysaccharide biosynthesis protein
MAEAAALRYLAFYLPQFHPIPENDEWWGKGFTEWTNVAKASPRFPGHEQPHLPADLGFYDLRLADTRAAQAALAVQYGINGFVYYHYWFNGRRLLDRPFQEVLRSGEPELPFALCWANENWTRIWSGGDRDVLLTQSYSDADDLAHIRNLAEAFSDHRYIRVDGRPVFLVYRTSRLPDARRTADTWRAECSRLGVGEPYLCAVEAFPLEAKPPAALGFDAAVEFAPNRGRLGPRLHQPSLPGRVMRRAFRPQSPYRLFQIHDYGVLADLALTAPDPPYLRFPGVTPGWDNTARRARGALVLVNSTPEQYERWLHGTILRMDPPTPQENFIFVNAWNEWAEGNHLEPSQRWGRAYLEAHARAVGRAELLR